VTIGKHLRERIEAEAQALGFAAIGFARADATPRTAERLREWLASGAHGGMIWIEETAERRGSPAALWPEVRSVISLGMSYAPAADPLALADEPEVGRISVYAQGADYHDTVKKALKALARWLVAEAGCQLKVFVDTAPVMEKPLAEGQASQSGQPQGRLLAVPRRRLHDARAGGCRRAAPRPLRLVQRLPRCLPHQRLSRALPPRCAALHLLSHDRA
jgi:stage V sporulation protein SpoVS